MPEREFLPPPCPILTKVRIQLGIPTFKCDLNCVDCKLVRRERFFPRSKPEPIISRSSMVQENLDKLEVEAK